MKVVVGMCIAVGLMAVATTVNAQDLTMGRQEISLSGYLEVDTPAGTDWNIGGAYGYFIRDSWEVGGALRISDNNVASSLDLGGFTEYNFMTATEWVPYLGAGLLYGEVNPEQGSKQDAFILNPYFGLKYFISDDVSLFGQANFEIASDDLFVDENANLTDTNWNFELGVRFYL